MQSIFNWVQNLHCHYLRVRTGETASKIRSQNSQTLGKYSFSNSRRNGSYFSFLKNFLYNFQLAMETIPLELIRTKWDDLHLLIKTKKTMHDFFFFHFELLRYPLMIYLRNNHCWLFMLLVLLSTFIEFWDLNFESCEQHIHSEKHHTKLETYIWCKDYYCIFLLYIQIEPISFKKYFW